MFRRKKKLSVRERIMEMSWTLAQLGGLVFFAWINAAKFDQTELRMLGEFAVYYKLLKTLEGYSS